MLAHYLLRFPDSPGQERAVLGDGSIDFLLPVEDDGLTAPSTERTVAEHDS
jgi:hypothetical protein